ncbi:MAG TPA: hypothetical protein VFB27_07510 [Opitutaceae bacterium]|nr:hypothetical protein [Opitutaceae bacterium]
MFFRLFWLCAAALLIASCRDEKITSYRVPKEAALPPPAGLATAAPGAPAAHWKTPAGWQERAPDGVRKGSFLVGGANGASADMSVTVFPGDVGGDLANVNRWRGQLGLGPIDNAALAQTVQTVDAPAGKFSLVDLGGKDASGGGNKRLLGAWLKQADRTWFFKLVGDDALVAAQRDTFMAFLQSVAFDATPAGAPVLAGQPQVQSTNDLPKNPGAPFAPFAGGTMPADAGTAAPDAAASAPTLTWTAPAGWQAKSPGQMRLGSFDVPGAGGAVADVSVIAFPGEAGGIAANINRWRGQLGLAPLAENDLAGATTTLDANGLHFIVVDLAGQSGGTPARMLAAIASFGGQTYFFKMLGPDAVVAGQKQSFLDFLKTVKAP